MSYILHEEEMVLDEITYVILQLFLQTFFLLPHLPHPHNVGNLPLKPECTLFPDQPILTVPERHGGTLIGELPATYVLT